MWDLLEVLKSHVFKKGWVPQNKASPLFLIDPPIMFCISFLKCLKPSSKTTKAKTKSTSARDNELLNLIETFLKLHKDERGVEKAPYRLYFLSPRLKDSCQILLRWPLPFASPNI